MTTDANPYRFGDLLALARQSWIRRMAAELEDRGFADYRRSDAATLRRLRRGPASVGELGVHLGVTRQAARKVARGLEERGYASTQADAGDARKLNVVLTTAGRAYADAIIEVIAGAQPGCGCSGLGGSARRRRRSPARLNRGRGRCPPRRLP